jgi:hypothetical protein
MKHAEGIFRESNVFWDTKIERTLYSKCHENVKTHIGPVLR